MTDYERELRALDAAESDSPAPRDETTRRLRQTLRLLAEFSPQSRGACPGREQLVAYHDQALEQTVALAVERHVALCPFCAGDLADLRALATPPLFEAVIRLVGDRLRLVSHSFASSATPAPAPARGDGETSVIELGARDEQLGLQLRIHSGSATSADLRVHLTGVDAPGSRARINLLRDDELLESRLSAADEEVIFSDVARGDYTVAVLPVGGDEIARVALRFEDEEG